MDYKDPVSIWVDKKWIFAGCVNKTIVLNKIKLKIKYKFLHKSDFRDSRRWFSISLKKKPDSM